MRTLSATLIGAQKRGMVRSLVKTVITKSPSIYGYDKGRILSANTEESPWSLKVFAKLDNEDKSLTAEDFKGGQLTLSKGVFTGVARSAWQPGTAYALEDVVIPTTPNGYQYKCRVAGTSANQIKYENYESGDDGSFDIFGVNWLTQTFTPSVTHTIGKVSLKLYREGLSGTVTVSIRATSGGTPTGDDLCSGTTDGDTLTTNSAGEWRNFVMSGAISLMSGTKYAIVVRSLTANGTTRLHWRRNSLEGYAGDVFASNDSGSTWPTQGLADMMFAEYGVSNEPTFPTTLGTQVTDGSVTWEMDGKAGDEYSIGAWTKVIGQKATSSPSELSVELECWGIPNLLGQDKALSAYTPTSSDTSTVKTLLSAILGATLAPFTHCQAYTVVYSSEDSLIDTYQPKDSFRVYKGGSRLAAVQRLINETGCAIRWGADGKVYIFVPTTSGVSYDYEYSLAIGYHTFFAKAYRQKMVIPNRVLVESQSGDSPTYSGAATDATSYALMPITLPIQRRLTSDAQAASIAAAKILKEQIAAEGGSGLVPMNVGAEVYDYVKITDARENDSVTGNIGYISSRYNVQKDQWEMSFGFGGWANFNGLLSDLENQTELGQTLARLYAKDAYIERLTAGSIDMSSVTLDTIGEGTTYQRVKSVAIDANGMVLLDQVIEGTHGLVKATQISGGEIVLSSTNFTVDKNGVRTATSGTRTELTSAGLKGFYGSTLMVHIDSTTGQIKSYASGSDAGIVIIGTALQLKDVNSVHRGYIEGTTSAEIVLSAPSNGNIRFSVGGTGKVIVTQALDVGGHIIPTTVSANIGSAGSPFNNGYAASWGATYGYFDSLARYSGGSYISVSNGFQQGGSYSNTMGSMYPYGAYDTLGTAVNKWYAGYFSSLPSCPEGMPAPDGNLALFKLIKAPSGMVDGKRRFLDTDLPDEFKTDVVQHSHEAEEFVLVEHPVTKKIERRVTKPARKRLVPTGEKEIEYINTISLLVQATKEAAERIEALEAKVGP